MKDLNVTSGDENIKVAVGNLNAGSMAKIPEEKNVTSGDANTKDKNENFNAGLSSKIPALKKYKLVVSDFDGTLRRSDDTVSEHTKKVIAEFKRRGGIFTISTGRMHKAIASRIADVGLTGRFPLMSFQGAFIRDSESGDVLLKLPIERDFAIEVANECKRLNIYCHYYTFDELYIPEITESNTIYCKLNRITPTVVGDLAAHLKNNREEIAKVLCIVDTDKIQAAQKTLNAKFGDRASVFISAPQLLEVVSSKAGKGNGLKFAAKLNNIDLSETIAVGDEMNDYTMIQAAGLGVAVSNANEKLKSVADYITLSNDEDGVAAVIEKFCL